MEKLVGKRAADYNSEDMQKLVEPKVAAMRDTIQKELEAKFRGSAVAKPEDYAFTWSEADIKDLPADYRDDKALAEDDMVKWWRGFAHEMGLGQEQFMKGIGGYLRTMQSVTSTFSEAEAARLGENRANRVDAVKMFIETNVTDKAQAEALKGSMKTADAIAGMERLMSLVKPGSVLPGTGTVGNKYTTLDDIKKAKLDPRYSDPARREPAYVREIDEALKRLFPG